MKAASILNILLYVALLAVAAGGIYSLVRRSKVKKNGIETNAVVTKAYIDRIMGEGFARADPVAYVSYRNQAGQTVEAKLSNPSGKLSAGMQIRIKYMPEKPNYAVWIK